MPIKAKKIRVLIVNNDYIDINLKNIVKLLKQEYQATGLSPTKKILDGKITVVIEKIYPLGAEEVDENTEIVIDKLYYSYRKRPIYLEDTMYIY